MNKDKKSIALIAKYLQKESKKARLITVAELAEKLFQKAPQPVIPAERQGVKNPRVSAGDTEVGARLKGQRKKKGELAGHALYPHLRPMYRTVHRRVPRELVFKAIRWVNPDRMFPISRYDKKKLMSLSREEFLEAFAELAKYRREAHVINNRYGQMINMIDAGQLPYYIPYANIPEQRYADLQQYRDRAERLGKGASDWGWELDHKAEEFRQVYENRDFEGVQGRLGLDDISDLWDDGPPPFMRVREGRKNQRLMRAQRRYYDRYQLEAEFEDGKKYDVIVAADSESAAKAVIEQHDDLKEIKAVKKLKRLKMPRKPQINVREFVAVNAAEVRVGGKGAAAEQNRMPRSRDVRGAEVFLLRQPDGRGHSYLGDRQYTNAVQAGQARVGPKGEKIDLIFDDEVIDPEIRRWMRVSQRGLVPHKGGASRPTEGHSAATPGGSQQVDLFGRPADPAPRPAAPAAGVGAKPGEAPEANSRAVKKTERIVYDLNEAFAKHNIDISDLSLNPEKDVFDSEYMSNPDNYEDVKFTSAGGIHATENVTVVMKDGSKWIWKATKGEQYGELATWALAAALNTQVAPHVEVAMIPWDVLPDQFKMSERGQRYFRDQGGHFMRYEDGGSAYKDSSNVVGRNGPDGVPNYQSIKFMDTKEKRSRLFAMSVIDSFTSNYDRNTGNAVVDESGGVVAIDSGFADTWHSLGWENNGSFPDSFRFLPPAYEFDAKRSLRQSIADGITTADEVRTEAREWFDANWNPDKLIDVAAAFVPANNIPRNLQNITADDFINATVNRYL